MCDWSRLPTEILKHIMSYVNYETGIFHCIYVCKAWKNTAQSLAYSDINILSTNQLRKMENAMQNNTFIPGTYTKSLNFYFRLNLNDMRRLSNLFPFTENIVTSSISSAFYDNMTILHKESKFPRLKTLPVSYDRRSDQLESYINCALEYRDTLTTFGFHGQYWTNEQSPYYYTKEYLQDFTRLSELFIENLIPAERQTIQLFDSIIDYCPNLKSLNFLSRYSGKDTKPVNLPKVKPRPDIQELVAHMAIVNSDDILSYTKHKFPSLKQFELINEIFVSETCMDKLVDLLGYISTIPEYTINRIYVHGNFDPFSQFWSLPINNQLPKRLEISFPDRNIINKSKTLVLKKLRSLPLCVQVTCYQQDNHGENCYELKPVERLIKETGEFIYYLSIDGHRFDNQGQHEIEQILNSVFVYCIRLKSLRLTCLELDYRMSDRNIFYGLAASSLSYLDIVGCCVEAGFLLAISKSIQRLNRLGLIYCEQRNRVHGYNSTERQINDNYDDCLNINMPHTSIEILSLEVALVNHQPSKIFLETVIGNRSKGTHFLVDLTKDNQQTQEIKDTDYKEVFTSRPKPESNTLCFFSIHCQSISRIVIKQSSFQAAIINF